MIHWFLLLYFCIITACFQLLAYLKVIHTHKQDVTRKRSTSPTWNHWTSTLQVSILYVSACWNLWWKSLFSFIIHLDMIYQALCIDVYSKIIFMFRTLEHFYILHFKPWWCFSSIILVNVLIKSVKGSNSGTETLAK